jgi:hypothetical protein
LSDSSSSPLTAIKFTGAGTKAGESRRRSKGAGEDRPRRGRGSGRRLWRTSGSEREAGGGVPSGGCVGKEGRRPEQRRTCSRSREDGGAGGDKGGGARAVACRVVGAQAGEGARAGAAARPQPEQTRAAGPEQGRAVGPE